MLTAIRREFQITGDDPFERVATPQRRFGWGVLPRLVRTRDRATALRVRFKGEPGAQKTDAGLLDAFVRLATASDEAILRFAQQYGPLELCMHELPIGHPPGWVDPRRGGSPKRRTRSDLKPLCIQWMRDQPVETYRQKARELQALLRVAATLGRGATVPKVRDEDWALVTRKRASTAVKRADVLAAVADRVNGWLINGRVQPIVRWSEAGSLRIEFSGIGMWWSLGQQLAFAVVRVGGIATCHGCGVLFTPSRRPREDQRSWCLRKPCRRAARRQAMEDWRAKKARR